MSSPRYGIFSRGGDEILADFFEAGGAVGWGAVCRLCAARGHGGEPADLPAATGVVWRRPFRLTPGVRCGRHATRGAAPAESVSPAHPVLFARQCRGSRRQSAPAPAISCRGICGTDVRLPRVWAQRGARCGGQRRCGHADDAGVCAEATGRKAGGDDRGWPLGRERARGGVGCEFTSRGFGAHQSVYQCVSGHDGREAPAV